MPLDRGPRLWLEFLVEIGRDVAPGLPAMDRLSQAGGAFRVPVGECAHEHHPPAAEPLFGCRQTDPEPVRDGRDRPPDGVMEDDHRPIAGWQPDKGIFELVAQLGPGEDLFRIDGVVIVMPAVLDVRDGDLVALDPRAIDDEVDEDPVEPRPYRGCLTKLPSPGPGPQGSLLGQLLGLGRVAGQLDGQASEPRQLGRQGGSEAIGVGRRTAGGRDANGRFSSTDAQRVAQARIAEPENGPPNKALKTHTSKVPASRGTRPMAATM